MPGVTRDLISTEVRDDYVLLDTGGIGMEIEMTPKKISVAAEEQSICHSSSQRYSFRCRCPRGHY